MNLQKSKATFSKTLLLIILFYSPTFLLAQRKIAKDSTKTHTQLSGEVTVTNNGISFIPTFMLGKPATIFDLSARKNRFSFDPQLRFAIEDAKPWSFIFWLHYKLIQGEKFKMSIGGHPSVVFGTTNAIVNGTSKELFTSRRFFAGELTPNYSITKNVNIGLYYLYSHGVADATRHTNFVALTCRVSNIKLGGGLYMKLIPQVYYLKMDALSGYYVTSTIAISKRKTPFTISSILNKKIQSSIPSKDFVWNVSLSYAF